MKNYIPRRTNAESNLKFRIAIFGSHFSKVEKSRSRHVVSSKFLACNKTCKERCERNKRKISREMDLGKGIWREIEKEEGKRGREGEREAERENAKEKDNEEGARTWELSFRKVEGWHERKSGNLLRLGAALLSLPPSFSLSRSSSWILLHPSSSFISLRLSLLFTVEAI